MHGGGVGCRSAGGTMRPNRLMALGGSEPFPALSQFRKLLNPGWCPADSHPRTAEPYFCHRPLDVEVQSELKRVRALAHLIDLGGALVIDVGFDDLLGEDIVLGQELVILFQGIERAFQRCGQ